MDDQKVIKTLSSLRGIGVWTAEMLLIFCMQRPDVLSYGDGAILKGMQILYHHRKMDKNLFEKYRKRYSHMGRWPACIFGPLPAKPWRNDSGSAVKNKIKNKSLPGLKTRKALAVKVTFSVRFQ